MIAGLVVVTATLTSNPASSGLIFSAGAGGVSPWEGDGGYSIAASLGNTVFSEHTRLALEFEYRNTEATVDLEGLDPVKLPVHTYDLRGLFRFVVNPGGFTPYLGFGGGLKLIAVNDSALKEQIGLPGSLSSTNSYGVSGTLMALLGLEMPLFTDNLAIFVEARGDYAWEFTDGVTELLNNGHAGAFTGMGGLRLSF